MIQWVGLGSSTVLVCGNITNCSYIPETNKCYCSLVMCDMKHFFVLPITIIAHHDTIIITIFNSSSM